MIFVDTSTWIDHLRRGDRQLTMLLEAGDDVERGADA
jgi:predicted nucleic acid-binding protein